jgi:hypothetical protein
MSAGQWILVIVVAMALVLLLWWWLHRGRPEKGLLKAGVQFAQPAPAKAAPPEPDDLSRIEGIGPEISAVLVAAGIATFSELAAREPEELKRILVASGVRRGDPATWPKQAALAAQGRWDDLAELQAGLHGGRNR